MPLRIFGRIAFYFALLLTVPYVLLVAGTSSAEFKAFAESKVSDYLKADVRVGKIRVGFFNRIILSDFEIHQDSGDTSPYRLEVDRMVFHYSFHQLLKRNFKIPAVVLLQSPRLVLVPSGSPLANFEKIQIQHAAHEKTLFELVGKGVRVQVLADFQNSKFSSSWETPFGKNKFEGKMLLAENQLSFSSSEASSPALNAFVDFTAARGSIRFDHQNQSMDVQAAIQPEGFELAYDANHWNFSGMDLVSAGTLSLRPLKTRDGESFRFETNFKTELFIWEFVPFEDFSGEFEVNASGIRQIKASWGKVFKGSGDILSTEEGWQSRLTIRVNGFDLAQVQNFASKPLPRDLGGLLKGQLKMDGALMQPSVGGRFTIQDGHVGQLEFDSGVIQLDGIVPYLTLKDSRVLKGRTSLALTGGLDLSLKNMFYGMQIRKFDQGILWNGMEMSLEAHKENRDLEMDTGISYFPVLGLQAGKGSAPEQDTAGSENYLELGPRLRF